MTSHILILADGRSPTTQSWVKNIQTVGYQVSLISTFPCSPLEGLREFHVLPIAFSRYAGGGHNSTYSRNSQFSIKNGVRQFAPLFQSLRYFLGPLSLLWYVKPYQRLIETIQPDIVHALRIPFEGMLGSFTPSTTPFLTATWGNDLTLHARGSWLMRRLTQRCLEHAAGLTSDTQRDVRLAQQMGLTATAPTLVVPGSGGLNLEAIQASTDFDAEHYGIPTSGDWVVNPRGIRPGSVHQEAFIAAIPRVLEKHTDAVFICPSLSGNDAIREQVTRLGIEKQTFLLPKLSQPALWALFKKAQVFVSPSSHDGTPNTLLEAIACGCFPVAGDIESLREWICPGENGLLVNPANPDEIADAIIHSLNSPDLRRAAARKNLEMIKQRADQNAIHPKIKQFYNQFLS